MFDVTYLVESWFFDIFPLHNEIINKVLQFIYCEPKFKEELIVTYHLYQSFTMMKSLYLFMPIGKILGNGKYTESFFKNVHRHRNKFNNLNKEKLIKVVTLCIDEAKYELLCKYRIEYMDYLDIVHSYEEKLSNHYGSQYGIMNTLRIINCEYNEDYLDSLLIKNGVYLGKLAYMTHRDKYSLYIRL